jgi:hypothetical protein
VRAMRVSAAVFNDSLQKIAKSRVEPRALWIHEEQKKKCQLILEITILMTHSFKLYPKAL